MNVAPSFPASVIFMRLLAGFHCCHFMIKTLRGNVFLVFVLFPLKDKIQIPNASFNNISALLLDSPDTKSSDWCDSLPFSINMPKPVRNNSNYLLMSFLLDFQKLFLVHYLSVQRKKTNHVRTNSFLL